MSLGTVLRNARESKGLTIEQVTEQTRLIKQIVEDLEKDDFHRIVATVYGCGFIKLYAECVGVDPAPLQQEFREVYQGFRRPNIQTRAVNTPQERPAAPAAPKAVAKLVDPQPVGEPKAPAPARPAAPKVRNVVLAEPAAPAKPAASAREVAPAEAPKISPAVSSAVNSAASAVSAFFAKRKEQPAPEEAPVAEAEAKPLVPQPAEPEVKEEAKLAVPQPAEPVVPEVKEEAEPEAPVVEPVAGTPEPEPVEELAPLQEPVSGPAPEIEKAEDKSADGDLGELFAVSHRSTTLQSETPKVVEPQKAEEPPKAEDHPKTEAAEHHLSIPVTTHAPSWDDQPFREPAPWWMQFVKAKLIAAVLGGIVLLVAAIFVISLACRPKAAEDDNGEQVASVQAEEVGPVTSSDGSALFTEKVIPPSDCYVD